MMKFNYWMPSPCEDEWASRSLAELVVYLTRRYRQPTQRMEAIAAVLPDFVPSCLQRRAAFHRLASVFTSLCEAMETHVWLVDQILSPAIIRVERTRNRRTSPTATRSAT
jgi:iron-sulfur cluster repair protein YtfE (RIC family)